MINKEDVKKIVEDYLGQGDKFLVEVKVKSGNIIIVLIDGDNGVNVDDCVAVSRAIESGLDRDKEDFELSVCSSGLDYPFSSLRQYKKNIGRMVAVKTNDGDKFEGKLIGADEKGITIDLSAGKKKVKKSEINGEVVKMLNFGDIKETKSIIMF